MEIIIKDVGKKFNHNWIFRHINIIFETGGKYAIIGNNGSGKTTFLKILAGIVPLSEGNIIYKKNNRIFKEETIFRHLALVGPYTELIEEFTLNELFFFYSQFKKLSISFEQLLQITNFKNFSKLQVKNFSSGMKQKLKLALALFSETEILFLDEPTSNFDRENINWYLEVIEQAAKNKTLIVCSNQQYEYSFCQNVLNVNMYK